MTPHGIVSRSLLGDVDELVKNLREEDLREIEDVSGRGAREAILSGVILGEPSLTMRDLSGALIGILSVLPIGTQVGAVAFSGTPLIAHRKSAFLRGSRDILAHLDTQFDTLLNICDARNEVHHSWLKWLGFTFIRKIDRFGAHGVPVYEFARIRPNV